MVAIRLPQDIETRLNVLAHKTGRTKSFYIRQALEEHLEELGSQHQQGSARDSYRYRIRNHR